MQESGRDAVLYGPFSIVRPYYEIAVRRQHLLHDALTKLLVSSDALRKELRVRFIGEEGVDQGGVRKEFLQLLVQELFHASYGMYKRYNNDRFYYFTAEFAGQHENGIRMYQLCGVVIGLALYNHTILDVHFPLAVYRKLLGHRCGLLDLAEYMPEVAKSIHNVRNASAAELDMMGLTFAVSVVRDIALKDTVDKETLVTAANRDEYCDLLIDWYLHKSVEELFAAFKSGFEAIVMTDAYRLLNLHPIELRDLICGVDQEIDVHALRQSAKFQDGYTADSTTVLDFWQVLAELDQKQLRKFLWFLTGSDRIPVGGTSKIVITLGRAGPDSNL
ncbi:MAG: uncharacterized protein KVP18_001249 [Porospora cf. gigantea A]|uniref:uncharacterized protein n=1 Tax=Porospora cf. gigantea A TaxID=2853593 RepID=UPI00355A4EFF|nr:MAG: hypothetical protein KVP18_001249 [Porospora cf. gigantea A]